MTYPWYDKIETSDLNQGDLIKNCPILEPPEEFDEDIKDINLYEKDVVIMSQSCDLVNEKLSIVLVCPYIPLETFVEELVAQGQNKKTQSKTIDNLRKGLLPGYHLLNKDSTLDLNYLVVDFRNVYGVHFNALKGIVKRQPLRVRLQPPYREHLSQAFARYFMRVGLPQDIVVEGY